MQEDTQWLSVNDDKNDDKIDVEALRQKFDFVLQKHLRKMEALEGKEKVLEREFEQKGSQAKIAKVKSFINKIKI